MPKLKPTAIVSIAGLDSSTSEEDLFEIFSSVGEICEVRINYDSKGYSRGFGEIVFQFPIEAEHAVMVFDKVEINGSRICEFQSENHIYHQERQKKMKFKIQSKNQVKTKLQLDKELDDYQFERQKKRNEQEYEDWNKIDSD